MTPEEIWLLGLFVGLAIGLPVGLFADRILDILTRSADDRRS